MAYTEVGWTDNVTPLNADNLNHMDDEIKRLSDLVDQLTAAVLKNKGS